ncbi:hypothetical protein QUF61_14825 [Candidatus Venteria ishoeyi]|uniref:hypothetical protein n=1 Tax=Candidatus Venteria ishoeyi TaxID=1899563 RepID=UPI0025A5DA3C|nr:hypothetical protein [Candidatus Venteria ishoeyi]MDM8547762.1 hypothetical protein [Candidatus Venteria ishoeyi]
MYFIKTIFISIFLFFSGIALAVPPPWIASVEAENLDFSQQSCNEIAHTMLQKQGFARITPKNNGIFAAYRKGRDYHYKVVIKCFDSLGLVNVTVVSNRKGGLNKARQLLGNISSQTKHTGTASPGRRQPGSHSDFPDCADGPTLVRCLNTIPEDSLDIAQDYLEKRKTQ